MTGVCWCWRVCSLLWSLSWWTYCGVAAPTSLSQSISPHYSKPIKRATTHRLPQITYPLASTDGCHPFHRTKLYSTKPPPPLPSPYQKHSTKADTITLYTSNQPRLPNGETATEQHPLVQAKTSTPISDIDSSPYNYRQSQQAHFEFIQAPPPGGGVRGGGVLDQVWVKVK